MVAPAIIAALIQAAAAIGSSYLSRDKGKKGGSQGQTIDDMLASINGQGPYSDIYNMDEAAFERSYAAPARERFASRTAPEIQQQYIATGQQRGTGMEDTLTRAGVDMEQILNQQYATMQENAMSRKYGALNNILSNQGQGGVSGRQALTQGAGAYLGSEGFASTMEKLLADIFKDKGGAASIPTPETNLPTGTAS